MVQSQHRRGFVLIHGGGLESWVWERLIPYLHLPALAVHRLPPHTNRNQLTLTDCARYIHAQVEQAGFEDTILVAHSIAGVLAPAVALLAPQRVAHMVFVGANIPAEGMSALSAFQGIERWQVAVGTLLSAWNLTPQKGLEQYIRQRLCHDLDQATTEQVVQGGKHLEPRALFFERISRKSLPAIPSTYIKLLQDRALPPAIQDRMAATIGGQVMTLNCGHTAMLSRPIELAAILNTIADSVSTTARQLAPVRAAEGQHRPSQ